MKHFPRGEGGKVANAPLCPSQGLPGGNDHMSRKTHFLAPLCGLYTQVNYEYIPIHCNVLYVLQLLQQHNRWVWCTYIPSILIMNVNLSGQY